MPHLVHIAPLAEARKIRRNGIRARKIRGWIARSERFVWSFPVLPSYTLTHSWMRELKRLGTTSLVAITFKVGDDEPVFARHYHNAPSAMTAAEAVGTIQKQADPRGYEIILPRSITPGEIVRVNALPKGIGWRYWPEAKSANRWPCDCPACAPRGEVKARRYRERIPELQRRFETRTAKT